MSESETARPDAFLAALRAGGLVFDGAMATSLYEKGLLYTVCFEGRELWGDDADPTSKVSVEAFEPYLEAA